MFARTNKSSKSSKAPSGQFFEQLEGRQLYSASPAAILAQSAMSAMPTLTINAGSSSERIIVAQSGSTIGVDTNGSIKTYSGVGAVVINGNSGNDTIVIAPSTNVPVNVFADSGNDTLTTGSNNDILTAGSGQCSLIALGGKNNTLVAGSGYTNIWETSGNMNMSGSGHAVVHAIGSFINTSNMHVDGATFAEPKVDTQIQDTAGWVNVAARGFPLFSSHGPSINDLSQGEAGTCYFLSSLGSVAMHDPQQIRNIITAVGDGTYLEQFVNTNNGQISYVRVDGELPVSLTALENGQLKLEYEHLGINGSMWAALEEKGWAYFRASEYGKAASYGFAEGGTGQEGLAALGAKDILCTNDLTQNFANGQQLLTWIDQQLSAGKAVDVGTNPNAKDIPLLLVDDHEYSAVKVEYYSDGEIAGMWVHNPWGVDTSYGMAPYGYNDGANDGFVFVTPQIAYACFSNVASGVV